MAEIERLELSVTTNAGDSAAQLKSLSESLQAISKAAEKLKSENFETLSSLATTISELTIAARGLDTTAAALSSTATALTELAGVKDIKASPNLAKNIETISTAMSGINEDTITKIESLTSVLPPLTEALDGLAGIRRIPNLTTLPSAISGIAAALELIEVDELPKLEALGEALSALASARDVKISSTIAKQIEAIADAVDSITDDTIDTLERLAEALNQFDGVSLDGSTASSIADLQRQIDRLNGELTKLRTTSSAMRGVGTAAKSSTRETNKLFESIKRIAFYRIIRTVIKEIGQAFNEGLTNAYHFSSGINGSLAKALDSLATKSLTMKNQLGAAWGTLLQQLTPILLGLINLVTKAANVVTQFFAVLSGKSTYLKAIDYATKWTDSAKTATKAAKEWKNQLLGFDEINRLEQQSDSGSLTGVTTPDYSKMFEVEEVDSIFKSIKEKFDKLKASLDFTKLQEALGRLKTSFKGLDDVIGGGLSWAWDNILVPLAHWTIEELAPRLIDLLASSLNFLTAVAKRLAPVLEPLWEHVLKPLFKWAGGIITTGLDELIDLLDDLTNLINGDISWNEFINGLSGVQVAILALGGVAMLAAIGNITIGILSFLGAVPTAVGTAAPKFAAAFAGLAKVVAIGAAGVVGAVAVAYDVSKITEATKTYKAAHDAHENQIKTALDGYKKLYEEKGKDIADEWAKTVYDLDLTNADFDQAQDIITGKIEGYWADTPQNMWDGFRHGWDEYFGENGGNLWSYIETAFTNVIDWLKDLLGIHSPSTVFADIGSNIGQGLWNGFTEIWSRFITWLDTAWNKLKNWWQNLSLPSFKIKTPHISWSTTEATGWISKTLSTLGLPTALPKLNIQWYANGGFPQAGELFVARERGAELVGNFGGRTAVANNDQIEAGIEEAAYRGFMRALAESGTNQGGGGGEVVIKMNGRDVARAIYGDLKRVEREQGGSMIENFA